jgi:hypothetical protein
MMMMMMMMNNSVSDAEIHSMQGFLEYDAMQFRECRQQVPQELWYLSSKLHDVRSHH